MKQIFRLVSINSKLNLARLAKDMQFLEEDKILSNSYSQDILNLKDLFASDQVDESEINKVVLSIMRLGNNS